MKKTNKKLDKQISQALTQACEAAKEKVTGFQWLTHFADYHHFPGSLSVVCVFDSNAELEQAQLQQHDQLLINLIKTELEAINIKFNKINQHISFASEEDCRNHCNGNWVVYFKQYKPLFNHS